MTPEAFARAAGVSRETLDRLQRYEALLRTWQARINLIGRGTLDEIWARHFLDSAQLFHLLPSNARILVDLGSGAGFPGLVLAIMATGAGRTLAVHLIESDARKAAFLIEAARAAAVNVQIHPIRAKTAPKRVPAADVVTARALAPLDRLLPLAAPLLNPDGICLFLKGIQADAEIAEAAKTWRFSAESRPSLTDPTGRILCLRALERLTALPRT